MGVTRRAMSIERDGTAFGTCYKYRSSNGFIICAIFFPFVSEVLEVLDQYSSSSN